MGILNNVLGTPFATVITTTIDGDYTIGFNDTRIEVDATAGDVIITLPIITDAFKRRPEILIKRIDDSTNIVTIVGTGGNFDNDDLILFGFEGAEVYASEADIWRNITSQKRIKEHRENDMSSGVVKIDGDITTFFTFNAEPVGNDSFTINHPGVAVVVDRSETFGAKPEYIPWVPITIVSPVADGNVIVFIDKTGVIQAANVNALAKLPAYDASTPNMNDSVQLASYVISGGVISSAGTAALPQWLGNISNRLMGVMDSLGVINDFAQRITSEIIPGGLQLEIGSGKAISRSVGFKDSLGTQKPDIIEVPDVSPSLIGTATRDNALVSFGFDLDVLNYESPIGTVTAIPPNKTANRFLAVFPNNQFTGVQLGQRTYNTTILAINSFELSEFSEIIGAGVPTIQIAIDKSEIDLSNAIIKNLPRFL